MCKEKATRNGNGNSRLAEQLGIIRGKNRCKKAAYLKSHDLMPAVLPELFKSCNLSLAVAYIRKFPVVPQEVAAAAYNAGRGALLEGLPVAS